MERLSWDSEFFGVEIARVRVESAAEVERALDAASAACLYVVVPGATADAIEAALRAGGRLTALRAELELRGHPAAEVAVRTASSEDEATVASFAEALAPYSRFSADPRFERERVVEMYRIWAAQDLAAGLVRLDASARAGMVALSRRDDVAHVDLVYVDEDARGGGLARRLLASAIADVGAPTARVVTDARNLAAVRLYESAGFRLAALDAVIHVWRDELS